MSDSIFIVRDTWTEGATLIRAATKRMAERAVVQDRFVATKATPAEITQIVNAGGQINDIVDGVAQPTGEGEAAGESETDGEGKPPFET